MNPLPLSLHLSWPPLSLFVFLCLLFIGNYLLRAFKTTDQLLLLPLLHALTMSMRLLHSRQEQERERARRSARQTGSAGAAGARGRLGGDNVATNERLPHKLARGKALLGEKNLVNALCANTLRACELRC